MIRSYCSIGSNLGDRESYLAAALTWLATISGIEIERRSPLYETEPVGLREQPAFLNAVIELSTTLTPLALLQVLQAVEFRLGRTREVIWGPRTIDLDILTFGRRIIRHRRLQVPHPQLPHRRFVLVPLADLAADFVVPGAGKTVAQLLQMCDDQARVFSYRPAKIAWESSTVQK